MLCPFSTLSAAVLVPLTMNWLAVQRVHLELARWQRLEKLAQSILTWHRVAVPHQRGLVQVESGQVLRQEPVIDQCDNRTNKYESCFNKQLNTDWNWSKSSLQGTRHNELFLTFDCLLWVVKYWFIIWIKVHRTVQVEATLMLMFYHFILQGLKTLRNETFEDRMTLN